MIPVQTDVDVSRMVDEIDVVVGVAVPVPDCEQPDGAPGILATVSVKSIAVAWSASGAT